jgi:protein TonB
MPGVSIRISDSKGNGQTTTATANATFEFTGLRPGAYALDFTEPGFARARIEIDIAERDHATHAVVLPIDTREETLHITPAGPKVAPVPRTELERFFATRLAPAGSSPARPCAAGKPCVTPARKIVDRQPTYPASAVSAGAEGLVYLDARITRDGLVESVRLTLAETSELGEAAASAVREWRFEPARLNGIAVETPMTITVEFSLE